ncbi:MAG TPA: hypothetical protein P5316_20965, partial [Phycisphaerae bacterium]|nr:hypothetical protein [Phycisphaerae bacterium]
PSASGSERFLLPWRLEQDYGISRTTLRFVMPSHECIQYEVYFDTKDARQGTVRSFPASRATATGSAWGTEPAR